MLFAKNNIAFTSEFFMRLNANMSIWQSATLDGLIKINPSDPIPKWRSLTIFAVPQGSSTVSSKQFT